MNRYIIVVEGVISRPITVDANGPKEASQRARLEFAEFMGADINCCQAVDVYKQPSDFGISEDE
tara:strand:- start:4204 stop:4395 length:192 start_codon:yes stop_codon:yes gene_type:complete